MDHIEEFPGEEFAWAVGTALSPVDDAGESLFGQSAEQLVDDSFELIVGAFEDVGLDPPDRTQLIEAVRTEQRERASDWIYDEFLEGGRLFTGTALTDEQWQSIEDTIRGAHVEPPSRSAIDAMIADRQRG